MNILLRSLAIMTLALSGTAFAFFAQEPKAETVTPVFNKALPNVEGKNLTAALVSYPPGAKSPSHRHASSAFIFAYVLSGEIRSQVDGGEI